MSTTIHLVQQIQIASPCSASWNDMVGDDRSRFCSQCKLNVYNFAAMSADEGEKLIIEKEGKLCARIYRRYDGTILTKDCPVGLQAMKKRLIWTGMRAAAAIAFIAAAVATAIAGQRKDLRANLGPDADLQEWRSTTYRMVTSSLKRWMAFRTPVTSGWSGGIVMGSPAPPPPVSPQTSAPPQSMQEMDSSDSSAEKP